MERQEREMEFGLGWNRLRGVVDDVVRVCRNLKVDANEREHEMHIPDT